MNTLARRLACRIGTAMTMLAMLSGSAHAEDVGPDELTDLVKGRKWLIAMQGDLSHAGHSSYWDFNADGSMCVRFAGSKPDDRCADNGQWKLNAQTLCWDLKFLGEQYGYKSACVRVQKVGEQQYEAFNTRAGYRQFVFRPVK
jgi:hypothetical protein